MYGCKFGSTASVAKKRIMKANGTLARYVKQGNRLPTEEHAISVSLFLVEWTNELVLVRNYWLHSQHRSDIKTQRKFK